MSDGPGYWERVEAARTAQDEAAWGMTYLPDAEHEQDLQQLARFAFQRGDRLLQIDLPVAWVQGRVGIGDSYTRTRRPPRFDVLGAIEREGWHLEHVSAAYVQHGSSATKRMLANAGSTEVAAHGALVGLYVFRRAA